MKRFVLSLTFLFLFAAVLVLFQTTGVYAEDLTDGNEQPTGDVSQLCTPTPAATEAGLLRLYDMEVSVLCGDVSLDEYVRSDDAALLLRYTINLCALTEAQLLAADANQDTRVNSQDAACILRYLVKIDTLPPSGSTVAAHTPTPTPTATPTPSPTPEPVLLGKVVILDPGHGLAGSGWYGGSWTSTGYIEANAVFRIASYAKSDLEALGATVVMTRESLQMVGNYTRMAKVHSYLLSILSEQNEDAETAADYLLMQNIMSTIISEYNASTGDNGNTARTYFNNPYDATRKIHAVTKRLFDYENCALLDNILYISIHTNSPAQNEDGSYSTSARGTQVYSINNKTNARYYTNYRAEQNAKLGNCVLKTLPEACGIPLKSGTVLYNDYFMLREQNLTSVLIEAGYHTNEKDRAILSSAEGQKDVALGITHAIQLYFNGSY